MVIYPVVMCGGANRFLPLVDEISAFEATLLRLRAMPGARQPLVICAERRAGWVRRSAKDRPVDILLEPEPRGSAAAVAAAAVWTAGQNAEGVLVVVPGHHHIPDATAFAHAVEVAASAAESGGVVTLGVPPTAPSTTYGYVAPGVGVAGGVRTVKRFLEKPKLTVAKECVAAGYLWNSGAVIARADILIEEFRTYAPAILEAAQAAVAESLESAGGWKLCDAFMGAPKTSFEYAVLEKTGRALVLPVNFGWSDLATWDAVLAAAPKDSRGNAPQGAARLVDTDRSLVRLSPGAPAVTMLGLSDVALVGDRDHLLVCSLSSNTGIRTVVEGPAAPAAEERLKTCAAELDLWFRTAALPLWWTVGADCRDGGFMEMIDLSGRPVRGPKRARVQARQSFVYGEAARLGMPGDWTEAAAWGLEYLQRRYRREDGLYRTLVEANGFALDDHASLYDQAFVLLALATASGLASAPREALAVAEDLLDRVTRLRAHPAGGFRESGPHPFQADAHMHLLEAALAWIEAGGGERWLALGSEVVSLALRRFIDQDGGFLREFFSPDWSPTAGAQLGMVKPGHQFEWSWLLSRWDELVGDKRAAEMANTLFDAGRRGVDAVRGVAVDEFDNDTGILGGCARLWPQTEHLRAALSRARREPDGDRYLGYAATAADALGVYLQTPVRGLWRDKLLADGSFVEEPVRAGSLYHLMGAYKALNQWSLGARRAEDGEGAGVRVA